MSPDFFELSPTLMEYLPEEMIKLFVLEVVVQTELAWCCCAAWASKLGKREAVFGSLELAGIDKGRRILVSIQFSAGRSWRPAWDPSTRLSNPLLILRKKNLIQLLFVDFCFKKFLKS